MEESKFGMLNSNRTEFRTLQMPLTFLENGIRYTASIYSDDDNVTTKTKVKVETQPVTSETVLSVSLKSSGGQAIWITPAEK